MILTTIKELKEQIRKANKAPVIVPFLELIKRLRDKGITQEKLRKELNNLYKEDKIEVGSTLNSKYIKTK